MTEEQQTDSITGRDGYVAAQALVDEGRLDPPGPVFGVYGS